MMNNPHQIARDLDFIRFKHCNTTDIMMRMDLLTVVHGIRFEHFMVKLKQHDQSWVKR